MASEGMRRPSPPLPPDPAPKIYTNPGPSVESQQTLPATPSTERRESDYLRPCVDSSRSPRSVTTESPAYQQRQPIKDAVNYAANNVFEHSSVTNQMDPEFIRQLTAQVTAQVTEQVLQNLQTAGATPTPTTQQQQTQFPPPPPPAQSQEPRSPTRSSIDSTTARFTPPTPERYRDNRDERGYCSSSPDPMHSDTGSNFSRQSKDSIRSRESQRSRDTPRPFNTDSRSRVRRSSQSVKREGGAAMDDDRSRRRVSGAENMARERTPFRRESCDSAASFDGASRSQVRLPQFHAEETPLEKFWQPLFDSGNPTMRLSQFLRGVALHLIDDYEPKGSLVVTPAKMLQFLNETKIEAENYPWDIIFGGKLSAVSISMMYQKLLCQHHLIQDRYDKAPWVPGLTPAGFDWFMTVLIQAHPDSEYERLAKAVMNMPISNADNKSERFPKELSRRLFPAEPNIQAEQRLVSSLNHEPYVVSNLKGLSAMPLPPPPPPPSAPPSSFGERERKPYFQTPQISNAVDDDDLGGPPQVPIERERKPYTGREGLAPTHFKPDVQSGGAQKPRTNSGVPPQAMYNSSGPSNPMNIPQRQPHRMSAGQGSGPPPMSNGGYSKSGRRSPPPMRNPYARSEPDFVGSVPNSQTGSNLHPREQQYPGDVEDDAMRRYRSRSRASRSNTTSGNQNNDDDTNGGRGYPIPGRGVPIANGYEYGAGSGAPPMGQTPVGSYPSRRPTMGPGGTDDRRRSMYVTPTSGFGANDTGSDGYGSFANNTNMNGGSGYPPQQPYGSSSQH
ncbi:hypothetical protein LTR37_014014 [Vermiconidia calcicola]|uniref:Uncharacterized protein n=1 Tax=Vermiconidia calcicola TaxID=1690605 RepID=A0ACC3MV29_9PEZI|nr:hypothetical protein LTR37_014014 [Vermiconidia calcicola]